MPLVKSKSKKAVSKNIKEFSKGKTFKKTSKKYGKEKAIKQAIAVALETQRRSKNKK